MGIQIAVAGNSANAISQQELPHSRGSGRDARTAEVRAVALEKFTESLPGNENEPRHADILSTVADFERISPIFNRKLKFIVDHESHEVTVKVIDSETDKVIKVLPPKELQQLHSRVKEAIGVLFDELV
jgi:flagellar protein FlaG